MTTMVTTKKITVMTTTLTIVKVPIRSIIKVNHKDNYISKA